MRINDPILLVTPLLHPKLMDMNHAFNNQFILFNFKYYFVEFDFFYNLFIIWKN
jgi:hypothetical protein